MGPISRRAIAPMLLCAGVCAQSGYRPRPQDALVPDWITAGPMIGHVGPTSARVWMQVKKGTKLGVRGTVVHRSEHRAVRPASVEKLGDQVRLVRFERLPADTKLIVQIYEGEFPTRGVALSLRTAPKPAAVGRVRIAFGSCCNDIQFPKARVFTAAAQERPDLFLFAGDNTYYVREYRVDVVTKNGKKKSEIRIDTKSGDGDWGRAKRMFARQLTTRRNPWLQPLIRTVPCYAVWDDHDYGPDNSDRKFEERKKSLRVFRKMWANPDYGIKGTKGCFSSFRRGPVEVFLMDDRYHKYVRTVDHPDVPAEQCAIWGKEQLEWLCKGLRRSAAPVKLIVNGTQFLSQTTTGEGHFREARVEYEKLLDFLARNRIGGVVFLTGDRHHSEMLSLRRKDSPTILEFTSSPLSWGQKIGPIPDQARSGPAPGRGARPTVLWRLRGDSFGLVTVDIRESGAGQITCEVRDRNNRVPVVGGTVCRTIWALEELAPK